MKWKGRGRYTVEGTLIISIICLVTGLVILFGFYGHDRAVIQSTADKLSRYGSLWAGRYLHPEIREVDYELMKQGGTVDFGVIEDMGCRMLQGRLFCGELRNIRASQSLSGREVQVEIQTDFQTFFAKGFHIFFDQISSCRCIGNFIICVFTVK